MSNIYMSFNSYFSVILMSSDLQNYCFPVAFRLDVFQILTDNGKDLEYFEEETGKSHTLHNSLNLHFL